MAMLLPRLRLSESTAATLKAMAEKAAGWGSAA